VLVDMRVLAALLDHQLCEPCRRRGTGRTAESRSTRLAAWPRRRRERSGSPSGTTWDPSLPAELGPSRTSKPGTLTFS
jgi:hypothetical protein